MTIFCHQWSKDFGSRNRRALLARGLKRACVRTAERGSGCAFSGNSGLSPAASGKGMWKGFGKEILNFCLNVEIRHGCSIMVGLLESERAIFGSGIFFPVFEARSNSRSDARAKESIVIV